MLEDCYANCITFIHAAWENVYKGSEILTCTHMRGVLLMAPPNAILLASTWSHLHSETSEHVKIGLNAGQ